MKFLKALFFGILRNLLAFGAVFVLIAALLIGSLMAVKDLLKGSPIVVEEGSVLVIDLTMNITDAPMEKALGDYIEDQIKTKGVKTAYLLEVLDAIERAGKDDRISSIFLMGNIQTSNNGSGLSTLNEIRDALVAFREGGKPVMAYIDSGNLMDYYLISAADTIVMNPFGTLSFKGLTAEVVYFGDALKKYGVGVQVTRVGKYKSGVEPFTNNKMSDAEREQTETLLMGLWDEILKAIGESRSLGVEVLKELSNTEGILAAVDAKKADLIDELGYWDQMIGHIQKIAKPEEEKALFDQITLRDYIEEGGGKVEYEVEDLKDKNYVGIVYVEGAIVEGEGYEYQAGADRIAKRIRRLRQAENVKALVLRVNSPGGGVQASEKIQREVRIAKERMPVIVSFGTLAASGGYWISCFSDIIFSGNMTITGSIGVYGILFNVEKIANDYGITFDGVKTGALGYIDSLARAKTPEELKVIHKFTNFFYRAFVYKVAEGRGMEVLAVNDIAQGRVWLGRDAVALGLADRAGGLKDAIRYAVEAAELGDDWELLQMPEALSFVKQVLKGIVQPDELPVGRLSPLSNGLRVMHEEWNSLSDFNDSRGIYARLPFNLRLN